ncbi:MAG: histidine kinase [Snowella sp.]|nr:histidine kinase [Snowella sp.]
MPTTSGQLSPAPVLLQLLLFIDERPYSQENVKQIQAYIQELKTDYPFELQVIEIAEQPHLVEYFRLVATPSLVKISPEPRQTLAGSNIVNQLKKWWPHWEQAIAEQLLERSKLEEATTVVTVNPQDKTSSFHDSAEVMRLRDEIFQLKQEKEFLSEQVKFKDQILAMLAHDLRSPLTAASIAVDTLELLQHKPENERTPQLRDHLFKQSRKQFQIMNRLITDILQASKNFTSQFELHSTQFYLQTLGGEILDLYQEKFVAKSLILEVDIPQNLPSVYGDEELIQQVFANLLDNAIKYTPPGGKIQVSILHRTTQKIQVSIADTGPGIPEAKQDSIFEGHFRLTRDEAEEGYGLGLSFCRKIIQAHYGQIWVNSVLGQGSCFQFTLPVYR